MDDPTLVLARDYKDVPDDHPFVMVKGEAPGAYPNGTRVTKTVRAPSDAHGPGDIGTVVSSLGPVKVGIGWEYGYFVCWDDMPELPVLCGGNRLTPVVDA